MVKLLTITVGGIIEREKTQRSHKDLEKPRESAPWLDW